MGALKDVKARIVAQLGLVAGIGKVYDRLRYLKDEKDLPQFIAGGRLHVWMVHREASVLTDRDVNQRLVDQKDTVVITGFYAVGDSDDSEAAFDALIDAILVQLNNDRRPPGKLGGTVETADAPVLRKMDLQLYGQTQALCHHAEISMQVTPRYLQ